MSDITNTGRFSPETVEAEWIEGSTGPAVGARFRGHVRRTGMTWVAYWTKCTVTACEPGREFSFAVGNADGPITWSYHFEPVDGGTDVTESFELGDNAATRMYWKLRGTKRGKVNTDGMRETLERIKAAVEGERTTNAP